MHALGQFIQGLMDDNGWKQADLARRSGLSTAVVSRLLTRDHLGRMIEDQTLDGLARAFPAVGRQAFITKGVEAMGIPVDDLATVVVDLENVSNEALLHEVQRRMDGGSRDGNTAEKMNAAAGEATAETGSTAHGNEPVKSQRPTSLTGKTFPQGKQSVTRSGERRHSGRGAKNDSRKKRGV